MINRRRRSTKVGSQSEDYPVGYRRPPREHRFKPGQSGNPNGRPRGSKSFARLLLEELATKITIQENGVPRRITKQEAIVKQYVNKAMRGDHRVLKPLLGYVPAPEERDDPAKQAKLEAGFKEFVDALQHIAKIKYEQGKD